MTGPLAVFLADQHFDNRFRNVVEYSREPGFVPAWRRRARYRNRIMGRVYFRPAAFSLGARFRFRERLRPWER